MNWIQLSNMLTHQFCMLNASFSLSHLLLIQSWTTWLWCPSSRGYSRSTLAKDDIADIIHSETCVHTGVVLVHCLIKCSFQHWVIRWVRGQHWLRHCWCTMSWVGTWGLYQLPLYSRYRHRWLLLWYQLWSCSRGCWWHYWSLLLVRRGWILDEVLPTAEKNILLPAKNQFGYSTHVINMYIIFFQNALYVPVSWDWVHWSTIQCLFCLLIL